MKTLPNCAVAHDKSKKMMRYEHNNKNNGREVPLCNAIDKIVRECFFFHVCVLWLTNVYMRAAQCAQPNVVAQFNGIPIVMR